MARRTYTEDDKASALAALEVYRGDISKAARFLDIPRRTLSYWKNGGGVNEDVANDCQEKKGDLADRLEAMADTILKGMPAAVPDANLQQMAVAVGVLIDKAKLLRDPGQTGGGEANTDVFSQLSDDELLRNIHHLEQRARSRADAPGGTEAGVPEAAVSA